MAIRSNRFCALWLALGTFVSLSACAGDSGRYPSLAIRDAERISGEFTPAPVDREPVSPVVDERGLAILLADARKSHLAFLDQAKSARALVTMARGLSPEDNRWADAQLAMADLFSKRGTTTASLSELDLLEAQAATTFAPTESIKAAQQEIVGLIEKQDQLLAQLEAVVSQ